jgi:hypothetical protein
MIHAVGIHDAVHSSKFTVFKAVTGISGPIHRTFQPIASGNDVGLRYLPFRENHITYMALDRAARFFLTGPLSGCTVAVAKHNGVLWTFHSNDNVGAGAAARNTQAQSIREVREGLMIPGNAVHLCEYQTAYDGLGFVFGKADDAGRWKFYAHATSVGGATATRKWAEIR